MSKLRKWMMKEERENSVGSGSVSVSVDTSAIKLFGKTIAVSGGGDSGSSKAATSMEVTVAQPCASQAESEEVDGAAAQLDGEELGTTCNETTAVSPLVQEIATPSPEKVSMEVTKEVTPGVAPETQAPAPEAASTVVITPVPSQEKPQVQPQAQRVLSVEEKKEQCLRKPDKLIPCPRCDSLDTKFCYYNNYNINQPRHFCKSCQRYWTAGGTLRNVLVGAGRRKNKYGASQMKQDVAEVTNSVRMDHHESAQPMVPMTMPYGKVPPMTIPQCSSRVTDTGPSSVTSKDNSVGASPYNPTSKGFPSASAFKAAGAGMSSDSVSKLRQRTRTEGSETKADCGSSMSSGETRVEGNNTYVLSSRVTPQQQQQAEAQALWSKSSAPLGYFNGAWPYGYNIGWTGAGPIPGAPALCNPHGAAMGAGTPPTILAPTPPGSLWTGMWTQPGLPGMSAMPTFGWNMCQGGWTLPWRPVPVVAVPSVAPLVPESGSSMRKRENSSVVVDEGGVVRKVARVDSPEVEA